MTSVLESNYIEPTRPYSQKELRQMQLNLYRSLRLGKTMARHRRCEHLYFVKENGRKEKEMIEKKSNDVGNCSVCWKLGKTSSDLKNNANMLIVSYSNTFYEEPKYLSYENTDLESVFYKMVIQRLD